MAQAARTLATVSLDDKYALDRGRVFMTGTQALVRLPLLQRQRDQLAGLNTGGFISGYRGSPLGAYDQALWQARRFMKNGNIHFVPGVNEELGATAVWGSQQVNLWQGAKVDGVFGIWYGKGPGVDRSVDALKHANFAGTSRHGGVLAIAGDDHASKSSTLPHQSDHAFMHAFMPVINPAGVQEFLDYGLIGFALSRYAGVWVGFTAIADTIDTTAIVQVAPDRLNIVEPTDFELPPGGLNIRLHDTPLIQEARMIDWKLAAAKAFARANKLDKVVFGHDRPRLGLVTIGKSYLDVRQALEELDLSEEMAHDLGLGIYKVAMAWPLEPEGIRAFAQGTEEILVVEEKRSVLELQIKEQLYNWDRRPRVLGKTDETGRPLFTEKAELNPIDIARTLGERILRFGPNPHISERLARIDAQLRRTTAAATVARTPFYCSGCPHNTSTKIPEGSRGLAGIGCHYMVTWMGRNTEVFSQMGGEGVHWIGQTPFVEDNHVFANLGDGTYFHSGILAVRAAVSAKVNITYKILYNDAVAMTGGQPVDGTLSVHDIAQQLDAEGVSRIVVVSDGPEKYGLGQGLPHGTKIYHRDELDQVQRELREVPGVSVLIYEQTCAAEKRRRRKRGKFPDPAKRVVINELVCEGCGDCSQQSSCLSVTPVETEFGRKRQIDQSTCNKDFSCLKGFCPSFVTVEGGQLKKPKPAAGAGDAWGDLPEPALPTLDRPWNILVTGIGGTGVVTIGAILGMATHLEGRGFTAMDMAGLAQKGGSVTSHLRIAERPDQIHANRIVAGGADLLLAADMVVAANADSLSKLTAGRTSAVLNTTETITAAFLTNPDARISTPSLARTIANALGGTDNLSTLDASKIATALCGDSIATNLFLLGFAYQKGLIPTSAQAIEKAIEMNGAAVKMNTDAFRWGRRAALDLSRVLEAAFPAPVGGDLYAHRKLSETFEEMLARRAEFLAGYQDAAYAASYTAFVEKVRAKESAVTPGREELSKAVAKYLFKLMAYKDEYEVARLYTDTTFLKQVASQFEGDYKLKFHLAPPATAQRDPVTGHLKKQEFGPAMLTAFKVLARMKRLRGTRLDPFARNPERVMERQLIQDYRKTVEELLSTLSPANHGLAVDIASIPEKIRGFGHVKEAHLAKAKAEESDLLTRWRNPRPPVARAAE
ncbi:indolepyruvate ferredoxin oxidoreductase family protein [Aerophototrophica crusticola]|uniref:Indolepyruvate ferredoxin oxidoreductase family protein n=1 Tax=Aerophototrophica crusticola TaxID=1709002 RepID=A0A858R827_9PROT|nr:indolepyruvate ferredoxin oxidoreductase family protein [Rhodospirillaceae bacterium B3]